MVLEMVVGRIRRAYDHRVGIIEARVVRVFDAHLGVAVERTAEFAPQGGAESNHRIGGDRVVAVAASRHRMHHPSEILVFHVAGFLPGEVIRDRNRFELLNCGHGRP
jgi:D-tyrosyl-tRNA(Tyr) deacylase